VAPATFLVFSSNSARMGWVVTIAATTAAQNNPIHFDLDCFIAISILSEISCPFSPASPASP